MRAPWLIALIVLAVWWPIRTFWLSDDWLALHYASDLGRAGSDFAGNQYGLGGLVWFYRPLITLSFAFDYLIGGIGPFVSHLSNAIAHGLSAMLVGLLARRFIGGSAGWGAGLLWGIAPLHAGSVLWAVGRVDSHTTLWILLSVWLTVRWVDRGHGRLASLLAAIAALCSKESAMVLPGLVAIGAFAAADPGHRLRVSVRAVVPFVLLVGAYLGLRAAVLGHVIGGYEDLPIEPVALIGGLATWTARAVNPLLTGDAWLREHITQFDVATLLPWIGFVPIGIALAMIVFQRRMALLAGALLAFLGCCVPTFQFWTATEHLQNARYFTLPFAALVMLFAAGGPAAWLLALVVFATPHLQVRTEYLQVFEQSRQMHDQLRQATSELPPGTVFIAGLPAQNERGNVVMFHLGVDRLLAPPFGDGRHRTLALRPLDARPGVHRLDYGDTAGLPSEQTLAFVGAEILAALPPASVRTMQVAIDGPDHLTSQTFWDWHKGRAKADFVTRGVRAERYRISVFTAGGYLTSILPDTAPEGDPDGRVSLADWLQSRYAAASHDLFVVQGLRTPVTMDLEARFPVLIEAGREVSSPAGVTFERSHAGQLVWLQFDRDYAEWSAGRVADRNP